MEEAEAEVNLSGEVVEKLQFVNTHEQFLTTLHEHEVATYCKFILRSTCSQFAAEKVLLDEKRRLHWEYNIPYYHFGTCSYVCHQGKDGNLNQTKNYAEQRDAKVTVCTRVVRYDRLWDGGAHCLGITRRADCTGGQADQHRTSTEDLLRYWAAEIFEACYDHSFTKRYNKAQLTKKQDCPAMINVTRVVRFTEFKLSEPSSKYKKDMVSKKIKEKMLTDKKFGEEGFYFNLPSKEQHKNHFVGPESAVVEPIDKRVRERISNLVSRGERNPLVVMKLLEQYVENDLQECDKNRRRFYPDKSSVRAIISSIKRNLRNSPIDLENTQKMINNWDLRKHNVFYRPCTKDLYQEDCEEDGDINPIVKKNLLFVYQSKEMSNLYRKYGNNCVLLDATYKTCKYAIPLYFIVVETNVRFQVVGVIISQFETKEDISEGLEIFKSWNKDIIPKYGMVDFAAEEISSLEAVFPGIQVFICSFHREQAWMRWMSKSCNASIPKKEALLFLRNIANASTQADLVMALDNLKKWSHFQSSALKHYFEGTWEKEIQRWAMAFKPENMYQNTNNGVERLNKELKYGYLTGFNGCSLSEIINVVVCQFLPERYKMYVSENLKISPMVRKYDESLPHYLHSRPKWLIDHVKSKLDLVEGTNMCVTQLPDSGQFLVSSSSTKEMVYNVVFDEDKSICSCECPDFRKERLVCKHILVVGVNFPRWSLDQIHVWVFDNPIFQIDESVLPGNLVEAESHASPSPDNFEIENEREHSLGQLKLRGSKKRHLVNKCRSITRSIDSALWNLNEENLENLSSILTDAFKMVSSQVEIDQTSGLPMDSSSVQKPAVQSDSALPDYGKLKLHRKRGFSGRVGTTADMMRAAANISVEEENDPHRCVKRKK